MGLFALSQRKERPPIIKLLTIDEVCKILRVSKPTAYNLIHSKGFPRMKIGREWRVEEQLLLKWIQENSAAS